MDTVLTEPTNVGPDQRQYIEKVHNQLQLARDIAKQNILEAQKKYKAQHDKKAKEPVFQVRDKVWLDTRKHPVGLSPKMCKRWDGPYYITEDRGNHTFKLRRCSDNAPVKVPMNANRLRLYHDPQDRPTDHVEQENLVDMDDGDNEKDTKSTASENNQNSQPLLNGQNTQNTQIEDDNLY